MNISSDRVDVAIVGPTAVGKTGVAVALGSRWPIEIISVDSRQVYIGMDVATGKEVQLGAWREVVGRQTLEIDGVLVHGLNLVRPDEPFSVSDWLKRVMPIRTEIIERGRIPVWVGGTGFYFEALQGKIATLRVPPNEQLRSELEQLSVGQLQDRLGDIDKDRLLMMNSSDRSNPARLRRAIEVAEYDRDGEMVRQRGGEAVERAGSGVSVAEVEPVQMDFVGLLAPNDWLYKRADARVDEMLAQGLLKEAEHLLQLYEPDLPSMTGIGYAEMAGVVRHEVTLAEASRLIKNRTHDYIRRQLTWWKKQSVEWVDVSGVDWQARFDSCVDEKLAKKSN